MPTHNLLEQREGALLNKRNHAGEAASAESGPAPHPLINLQRQVGNAHVARMLAQRAATEEEEPASASSSAAAPATTEAATSSATEPGAAPEAAAPAAEPAPAPQPAPTTESSSSSSAGAAPAAGASSSSATTEEEIQPMRDPAAIQREAAPEEEEEAVQAMRDPAAIQREAAEEEEEPVQAMRDPAAIQREAAPEEEEEAVQAMRDPAAIQREAAPEEEEEAVQAMRDPAAIQREAAPEEEEEPVQAMRDPAAIQREAAPEEEEEAVQAMRDPAAIQREAAPEEEEIQEQRDPALQREVTPEVGLEGGPVSDEVAGQIQAKRGGGSPLPDATRTQMEGNFGTSFDDVRVHTDADSDKLNHQLGAKAFTTGNDIFFRQDTSPADSSLLGHELTHVVQQRSMNHSGPMTVGPAGDSYEQEADATSAAVTTGAPAAPQRKVEQE